MHNMHWTLYKNMISELHFISCVCWCYFVMCKYCITKSKFATWWFTVWWMKKLQVIFLNIDSDHICHMLHSIFSFCLSSLFFAPDLMYISYAQRHTLNIVHKKWSPTSVLPNHCKRMRHSHWTQTQVLFPLPINFHTSYAIDDLVVYNQRGSRSANYNPLLYIACIWS